MSDSSSAILPKPDALKPISENEEIRMGKPVDGGEIRMGKLVSITPSKRPEPTAVPVVPAVDIELIAEPAPPPESSKRRAWLLLLLMLLPLTAGGLFAVLGKGGKTNAKDGKDPAIAENAGDDDRPDDSLVAFVDQDGRVKLLDQVGTKRFLDSGGSEETEAAVQVGLEWLIRHQANDGHWSTSLDGNPDGGRRIVGRSGNDVSGTALGLLPFLARGETHRGSTGLNTYTKQVERAIKFLLSQQKPDGDLRGGNNMYTHALATIALCEALQLSADQPLLREPAQKAIDFIIRAQDTRAAPNAGGWRYSPREPGDLSVTSWTLMALKSGQMAGLQIPRETLDKATDFLRYVALPGDDGYAYAKNAPGFSPPAPAVMTAAGIVCRQYLQSNEDVRSPNMTRGIERILANPPRANNHNFYYYYYATYALFNIGGEPWKQWNPRVREFLLTSQDKTVGDQRGSWDPRGAQLMQQGGRVGVTALALLTLEVYYRNLPLNRPDLGEMQKDLTTSKKKP